MAIAAMTDGDRKMRDTLRRAVVASLLAQGFNDDDANHSAHCLINHTTMRDGFVSAQYINTDKQAEVSK
jgi:hypothetical protein